MAREILDLTNVDPADSDYPYGRVRDITTPGAGDGTPVNEAMLGDVIQFFNKLMDEGAITPNGLPDNDYSGFQLYEALEAISPNIKYKGSVVYTDGNNLPFVNISSTYYVANFTVRNVELNISLNPFANTVESLGDMPVGTRIAILQNSQVNPVTFTINSTNAGAFPIIRKSGVTANDTGFTPADYSVTIFEKFTNAWGVIGG